MTTFIGKHKNKFDADAIAEKYASKHGLIKEEVLAKWKLEGEISTRNGTACHSVIENYVLNGKIELLGISEKEKVAASFINDYFETGRLIPVDVEVIVYDEQLGLASQIDCIVKNKEGEHFILDWKTNKKIDYDSWGKFMFAPFENLPDCSYYHYSLQLELYKKMYTEYEIKDCYIVHLDNDKYNLIKKFNGIKF